MELAAPFYFDNSIIIENRTGEDHYGKCTRNVWKHGF